MTNIANVIINSNELNETEKVEAIVAIFGSHNNRHSQRDSRNILSVMKKGVPYSCADIVEGVTTNGSYETARGAAAILRRYVQEGLVERTYIKTGKTLEIENPRVTVLKEKINNCRQYHWYERYRSTKGDINSGFLPYDKFIEFAEALLAETKPTITIEEKKAVYTRLF
jgi:hypothetical protein